MILIATVEMPVKSSAPMTEKKFASQADLQEKKISFDKLSEHAYAYTAEGDPNTGIVIGDDAVMVIDTQATPVMAQDVIRRIRAVTDKPIKYVVLTHYHAVRVLGASGYKPEHVIASRDTYDLIAERGEADMKSEIERFPRLFRAVESVPGLTWPTLVFERRLTVWLGSLEVDILQLGRGHTKGDTVVWLPQEKILFSGDLVEYGATPYTGDAYLTDWPATLDAVAALKPVQLVPGRGASLQTPADVRAGLEGRRAEALAAERRGRRPGRLDRRHRSRATRGRCAPARRRRHGQRRVACNLLVEANARNPRSSWLRRASRRKGRELERGTRLLPRRAALPVRPAPRDRS